VVGWKRSLAVVGWKRSLVVVGGRMLGLLLVEGWLVVEMEMEMEMRIEMGIGVVGRSSRVMLRRSLVAADERMMLELLLVDRWFGIGIAIGGSSSDVTLEKRAGAAGIGWWRERLLLFLCVKGSYIFVPGKKIRDVSVRLVLRIAQLLRLEMVRRKTFVPLKKRWTFVLLKTRWTFVPLETWSTVLPLKRRSIVLSLETRSTVLPVERRAVLLLEKWIFVPAGGMLRKGYLLCS
jgi:hypothetical protein